MLAHFGESLRDGGGDGVGGGGVPAGAGLGLGDVPVGWACLGFEG